MGSIGAFARSNRPTSLRFFRPRNGGGAGQRGRARRSALHFRRSAFRSNGVLHPQFADLRSDPLVIAEWSASFQAHMQPLEFVRAERRVDTGDPVFRTLHGPFRQHPLEVIVAVRPRPQTPPAPFLSLRNQPRRQWIPLDVPRDRQQVFIALQGKALEPPLIKRAVAHGLVGDSPPHRMRMCQPPKKRRQLPIVLRPDHEVPMVREDAVRQDSQRMALMSLDHNAFKRRQIGVFPPQMHSPDSPIQDVINQTTRSNACFSRHSRKYTRRAGRWKLATSPFHVPNAFKRRQIGVFPPQMHSPDSPIQDVINQTTRSNACFSRHSREYNRRAGRWKLATSPFHVPCPPSPFHVLQSAQGNRPPHPLRTHRARSSERLITPKCL